MTPKPQKAYDELSSVDQAFVNELIYKLANKDKIIQDLTIPYLHWKRGHEQATNRCHS